MVRPSGPPRSESPTGDRHPPLACLQETRATVTSQLGRQARGVVRIVRKVRTGRHRSIPRQAGEAVTRPRRGEVRLSGRYFRRIGEATERLNQALTAATTTGRFIPCLGREEWLSENCEERAEATKECTDCPVIDECRNLAETTKSRFGVWAGRDRTMNPRREKAERDKHPPERHRSDSDGLTDPTPYLPTPNPCEPLEIITTKRTEPVS